MRDITNEEFTRSVNIALSLQGRRTSWIAKTLGVTARTVTNKLSEATDWTKSERKVLERELYL